MQEEKQEKGGAQWLKKHISRGLFKHTSSKAELTVQECPSPWELHMDSDGNKGNKGNEAHFS